MKTESIRVNPNMSFNVVYCDGEPQVFNIATAYRAGHLKLSKIDKKRSGPLFGQAKKVLLGSVESWEDLDSRSIEPLLKLKVLTRSDEISARVSYSPNLSKLRSSNFHVPDTRYLLNPDLELQKPGESLPFRVEEALEGVSAKAFLQDLRNKTIIWVRSPLTRVWWPYDLDPNSITHAQMVASEILIPEKAARCREEDLKRLRKAFQKKRYLHLPSIVPAAQLEFIKGYFDELHQNGFFRLGDRDSDFRAWIHGDPLSRFFQTQLASFISEVAGEEYLPFFVKLVRYLPGSKLLPHTDREPDALTMSVPVSYRIGGVETYDQWPLSVQDGLGSDTARHFTIGLGRGLIFDGNALEHYRGYISEAHQTTVMLLNFVRSSYKGKFL